MIKILFLIETLKAGGAEKVLIDLVNHMDQSKFNITVQTVWPCDSSNLLVSGVHYKSMYSTENKASHLRYRAEAESGWAYKLHIKDDYDIECAFIEMGPTKVLSTSTNKKAKKLAWVHCDLSRKIDDIDSFVAKTKKWYLKYDEVICVSKNVQESFINMFGKEIPTRILYNVIDDESVRSKAIRDLPISIRKKRTTFLSLGRLAHEKGYDILLRAFNQIIGEGNECDLWIAGEGEERSALEQYISEHNLEEYVRLLGYQDNPYPFIAKADVLVCSSRYEGLSTFITEGLILGKPVVTTACAGMKELLGNSEFGLITEINEESLYSGIHKMINDEKLRKHYADKSKLRGLNYSMTKQVEENENYFMKLVGD